MAGNLVGENYWQKNALDEIVKYCSEDVKALAELALIWSGKPAIQDVEIIA
jgi:hypothetical protein